MKEYFLSISKENLIGNKATLNNSELVVCDGENEDVIISRFLQVTKKGWCSTKKIIEIIDVLKIEDGGCLISKKSADILTQKYSNVNVKSFATLPTYYSIPTSNVISKFMGNDTDPYDTN